MQQPQINPMGLQKNWLEIMELIRSLWQDESGANAIEYVLLVALIATIVLGGVSILGQSLSNIFTYASSTFMGGSGGSGGSGGY